MTVLPDKYTHNSLCRLVLLFLFLATFGISAQNRNPAYEKYITRYSPIAVDHMREYRIPASITLAQGLLESGAGMSDLAIRSNNHLASNATEDGKALKFLRRTMAQTIVFANIAVW